MNTPPTRSEIREASASAGTKPRNGTSGNQDSVRARRPGTILKALVAAVVGQTAKLEQEGDTRYVQKAAFDTLGRLQKPALEKTNEPCRKPSGFIRKAPQDAVESDAYTRTEVMNGDFKETFRSY